MFRQALSRTIQRLAKPVDALLVAEAASTTRCRAAVHVSRRWYSDQPDEEQREVGNERVRKLADEILQMSLVEVADLTEILSKRLGIPASMGMGMPMGMPMAAAAPAQPAEQAAPEEAAPVKDSFDVKLEGFDAASKIKVIKEVRAITNLGLKEAKDMVEGAPAVIKVGLKKEEAEELKAKLEAAGAKIALV